MGRTCTSKTNDTQHELAFKKPSDKKLVSDMRGEETKNDWKPHERDTSSNFVKRYW